MTKIEFKDLGEKRTGSQAGLKIQAPVKQYQLFHLILIKRSQPYLIQIIMILISQFKLPDQYFQLGKEQIFVIVQRSCFVLKQF